MVFLHCRADDKLAAFLHLTREVLAAQEQTVVFCATMKHVEYLAAVAERAGIDCVVLYSQLDSVARNINIQKWVKCDSNCCNIRRVFASLLVAVMS